MVGAGSGTVHHLRKPEAYRVIFIGPISEEITKGRVRFTEWDSVPAMLTELSPQVFYCHPRKEFRQVWFWSCACLFAEIHKSAVFTCVKEARVANEIVARCESAL